MTEELAEFRRRIQAELDKVVEFWLKYSHDTLHGGFFSCLGRDGRVYDELKYVWLQGRQVWMYCRLYRTIPRFQRPEILEAAKSGAEFLRRFAWVPSAGGMGKCAFCLTRDGRAVKVQRTIFSECFYVMAMDELSRVTCDQELQAHAQSVMDQLEHWVRVDPSPLGRTQLAGDPPLSSLAVPMMLLCLVQQLSEGRERLQERYSELAAWCVQQTLTHVQVSQGGPGVDAVHWVKVLIYPAQRDGQAVLENVSSDGAELPGCQGRLQNPGHALEAGWFLLQYASEHMDQQLQRTAVEKFMENPFQKGWDKKHGGLFYFLDVDGLCPTQLEWNMKLWWPHCEALIAFLMAYKVRGEAWLLQRFTQVYQYTFSHFPDPEHGEWFGYLSQQGSVTLDFKGGPFKGFFHVPRCLYMCELLLDDILAGHHAS